MDKSKIVTLIILLIIIVIVGGITFWLSYNSKHEVLEETVAIFTNQPGEEPYSDLLGNPVLLDQYLGKVLVVVSWASWSPFSQTDLNMMSELSSKFSSEQVAFLAINRKETKEQASRYMSTIQNPAGVIVALDPRDRFYSSVAGYAMPEAVIYNQRGEVVNHFRGVSPKDEIEATINTLILKP